MLVHNVSRVPPPRASSSHRISCSPQWYSSSLGASARVTVASETVGLGAATVVSFTVVPAVPRLPSATKGAHSRSCAGSVIASQTFSGECRSSRTRTSVHFSSPFGPRSFCIRAMFAGPGVYCSRSSIFFSLALPTLQLGELNKVAAGVVQHGNGRASHVGGRHGELGAAGLDPLVVTLDVVGEKHGRGLVLLKDRLLVGLDGGVVVQRQLQLSAVRLLGRGHGQPAKWALTEIGLLGKTQYLGIEAQSFVLIVHIYAGQFDFHFVSPLRRSRFRPRRVLFCLPFLWWFLIGAIATLAVLIQPIKVAFESIHVSGPEAAELSQPGIHLSKRSRFQPVESALGVDRRFDEPGVAQHAQMLRHGRLRHTKPALDLSHRLLGRAQQTQYRAAVRLRNDFEYRFHSLYILYRVYTCQGILQKNVRASLGSIPDCLAMQT